MKPITPAEQSLLAALSSLSTAVKASTRSLSVNELLALAEAHRLIKELTHD